MGSQAAMSSQAAPEGSLVPATEGDLYAGNAIFVRGHPAVVVSRAGPLLYWRRLRTIYLAPQRVRLTRRRKIEGPTPTSLFKFREGVPPARVCGVCNGDVGSKREHCTKCGALWCSPKAPDTEMAQGEDASGVEATTAWVAKSPPALKVELWQAGLDGEELEELLETDTRHRPWAESSLKAKTSTSRHAASGPVSLVFTVDPAMRGKVPMGSRTVQGSPDPWQLVEKMKEKEKKKSIVSTRRVRIKRKNRGRVETINTTGGTSIERSRSWREQNRAVVDSSSSEPGAQDDNAAEAPAADEGVARPWQSLTQRWSPEEQPRELQQLQEVQRQQLSQEEQQSIPKPSSPPQRQKNPHRSSSRSPPIRSIRRHSKPESPAEAEMREERTLMEAARLRKEAEHKEAVRLAKEAHEQHQQRRKSLVAEEEPLPDQEVRRSSLVKLEERPQLGASEGADGAGTLVAHAASEAVETNTNQVEVNQVEANQVETNEVETVELQHAQEAIAMEPAPNDVVIVVTELASRPEAEQTPDKSAAGRSPRVGLSARSDGFDADKLIEVSPGDPVTPPRKDLAQSSRPDSSPRIVISPSALLVSSADTSSGSPPRSLSDGSSFGPDDWSRSASPHESDDDASFEWSDVQDVLAGGGSPAPNDSLPLSLTPVSVARDGKHRTKQDILDDLDTSYSESDVVNVDEIFVTPQKRSRELSSCSDRKKAGRANGETPAPELQQTNSSLLNTPVSLSSKKRIIFSSARAPPSVTSTTSNLSNEQRQEPGVLSTPQRQAAVRRAAMRNQSWKEKTVARKQDSASAKARAREVAKKNTSLQASNRSSRSQTLSQTPRKGTRPQTPMGLRSNSSTSDGGGTPSSTAASGSATPRTDGRLGTQSLALIARTLHDLQMTDSNVEIIKARQKEVHSRATQSQDDTEKQLKGELSHLMKKRRELQMKISKLQSQKSGRTPKKKKQGVGESPLSSGFVTPRRSSRARSSVSTPTSGSALGTPRLLSSLRTSTTPRSRSRLSSPHSSRPASAASKTSACSSTPTHDRRGTAPKSLRNTPSRSTSTLSFSSASDGVLVKSRSAALRSNNNVRPHGALDSAKGNKEMIKRSSTSRDFARPRVGSGARTVVPAVRRNSASHPVSTAGSTPRRRPSITYNAQDSDRSKGAKETRASSVKLRVLRQSAVAAAAMAVAAATEADRVAAAMSIPSQGRARPQDLRPKQHALPVAAGEGEEEFIQVDDVIISRRLREAESALASLEADRDDSKKRAQRRQSGSSVQVPDQQRSRRASQGRAAGGVAAAPTVPSPARPISTLRAYQMMMQCKPRASSAAEDRESKQMDDPEPFVNSVDV